MNIRSAGILLHISSLPSPFGIGDMGPEAYTFADFLTETRQGYWQIIPLTPPHPEHYSPYHSPSAFAGNPLLISPDLLVEDGLLERSDVKNHPDFPPDRVDFPAVMAYKKDILGKAYRNSLTRDPDPEYAIFRERHAHWLDDYVLFKVLDDRFGNKRWNEWPRELRDREPDALKKTVREAEDAIEQEKFLQYLFFKQWSALKSYCNRSGIQIIGDIPIYVDFNSADVWTHPDFFKLDKERRPYVVAGVPPDYFSATGQLWGHPLYNWDALKDKGYSWWMDRIAHNMTLCDLCRIDHFRGIVGYWEVPADEETALNGKWMEGPGSAFFQAVLRRFPNLPIIAEDLGVITPDVREVMAEFGFPGMKLLLFAFGEDCPVNPYAPHNVPRNSVIFTGTHDNNTVRGWYDKEADPEDISRLASYVGREIDGLNVHREMCRLALMSVADTAILPVQDLLGLGQEARMNLPSQKEGNWMWRLSPGLLDEKIADELRSMTELYGRAP